MKPLSNLTRKGGGTGTHVGTVPVRSQDEATVRVRGPMIPKAAKDSHQKYRLVSEYSRDVQDLWSDVAARVSEIR